MRDEKLIRLMHLGSQLAGTWIDAAVKKAQTDEQMTDQLVILQSAAVHLLATAAFNYEIQRNLSAEGYISTVVKEIDVQLEEMRTVHQRGEMQMHRIGYDA